MLSRPDDEPSYAFWLQIAGIWYRPSGQLTEPIGSKGMGTLWRVGSSVEEDGGRHHKALAFNHQLRTHQNSDPGSVREPRNHFELLSDYMLSLFDPKWGAGIARPGVAASRGQDLLCRCHIQRATDIAPAQLSHQPQTEILA